jgi:hypothetical protein
MYNYAWFISFAISSACYLVFSRAMSARVE